MTPGVRRPTERLLSTTDEQPDTNEILAAAQDAKAARERANAPEPAAKGKLPLAKIGVAAGLGSAALAAAVLFAQRRKKD